MKSKKITMTQSLELAKQGVHALQNFNLQLQQNLIPIRSCGIEPVKAALRYAMVIIGLKGDNVPVREEKNVVFNFIQNVYPDFTPEEIKYAFDLAVARKYEDVEVSCFQNFSCEYIGKILAAYVTYGSKVSFFASGNRFVRKIQEAYEQFLQSGLTEYYPVDFYHQLRDCGIIKQNYGSVRAYHKQIEVCKIFYEARSLQIPTLWYTDEYLEYHPQTILLKN